MGEEGVETIAQSLGSNCNHQGNSGNNNTDNTHPVLGIMLLLLWWLAAALTAVQHVTAALHVCTFATHITPGFCQTLKSALHNHLNVTVAGWHGNASQPQGSAAKIDKIEKVARVLNCLHRTRQKDPRGIVLAADAFDALF